jgi:Na+-driven multidrug efflux pump
LKKALKYPLFILKIYGIIFIIILAYILIYAVIDPQSGNVTPWIMVVFIWFVFGIGWVPLVIAAFWEFYKDDKLKKNNQSKND